MNTLLNMNDQNLNDYQSTSPNCSEITNIVSSSQFSTPHPILSASVMLNNDTNNFPANHGELWPCFILKVFIFIYSCHILKVIASNNMLSLFTI